MALQGDLASFALPDVLRLLAGTAKTGRLTIEGSPHTGEVWFREGEIAGGTVTSRPSASAAAEIVYELLQFDQGSFAFDDDDVVEGSDSAEVEGALAEAERLQAEWDDVTQVVPSLDHWLEMTPELATGEVTLDGDQWRLLAVIAGGAPVQTVAKQFSESDLAASKRVKAMATGFYGRVKAYDDGLAAADTAVLAESLRRNLYGTAEPGDEQVAAMADYLRQVDRHLAGRAGEAVLRAEIDFGASPT